MTSSCRLIKRCLLAPLLLLALLVPAHAASFSAKRGINLDIWVTWPTEDQWHDEAALLPFPEWRKTVSGEDLSALKAAGFDFVRMPVDPAPFLSEQSAGLHERLHAEVLDAVRLVNEAGLKVVVDLHTIERSDNPAIGASGVMDDASTFDNYLAVVRRLGQTLSQEDPALVAFELMNEPPTVCDRSGAELWQDRLDRLHAAARASATRLTLVLTGGCHGSAEGLTFVNPRRMLDDNVLWTFHAYQPFLLTHQGALWAGDFIRYVQDLTYPLGDSARSARTQIRERILEEAPLLRRAGMLAYLDEQLAAIDTAEKLRAAMAKPFDTVDEWARAHSIPTNRILLGEFGMIRQEYEADFIMPPASRAAYVADMIEQAESRGFGWAIWSYGGAFGVVEGFGGDRAEPDVLDVVRGLAR